MRLIHIIIGSLMLTAGILICTDGGSEEAGIMLIAASTMMLIACSSPVRWGR